MIEAFNVKCQSLTSWSMNVCCTLCPFLLKFNDESYYTERFPHSIMTQTYLKLVSNYTKRTNSCLSHSCIGVLLGG